MTSRLDQILDALHAGQSTLDEARRAVAAAVRENPKATRMWPMLIDSRVTQKRLAADVARALLDAMEAFEPDKTLWLAPATRPIATPAKENKPPATPAAPAFEDMEQLRAYLWDAKTAAARDAKPDTIPIQWMDDSVAPLPKRVTPPQSMPGITPAISAPELGTVIGNRYRLDSQLGYGGIGQVFSATDLRVADSGAADARVTIKLIAVDLKREPQALPALQQAIAKNKTLRHPNIVATLDLVHDDNRVYVVMEPLTGHWLGDQIRQVRKVGLPHEVAWPIIEGIANGLSYAHAHDVIHSDLSPYSVFLTSDGTPKIMSFGLIHAVPTSNESMDLLDTMTLHAYSEAYTADTWATHATPVPSDDLYPLGVIAYELFTGKHPFGRHSLTTARQKNLSYDPVPGLNSRAIKLLAKCLSFERSDRPKNAAKFIRRMEGPALLRWLMGDRVSAITHER